VGFFLKSVHDANLLGEAVRVAQDADLAIVFTGHDPQWETGGRDQDSFNLPQKQIELVLAVASVNTNTIVVNSTGVAISMPWLAQVKGVIQAWFSGHKCGNAIANILTGAVNPEGRLPVTFPKRLEDTPAYGNFPGQYVNGQLRVDYADGVFFGYRSFDGVDHDKVNFPFDFGLSYTFFEYGSMEVSQHDAGWDFFAVKVNVSNTGSVSGGVLVQVYVGTSTKRSDHPLKSLAAFKKVRLEAGESQTVDLLVSVRDFAYYDEREQKWAVDEAEYVFMLGSSAADSLHVQHVFIPALTYDI
jgi:beta-glucosidase